MGRPSRDLLGRRVGESVDGLRRLPGFEGLGDAVQRVLRTGETMPYEAWLHAPGEPREHAWLVSLSPLKDNAGRIRGLCLAAMDSTEQFLARRRLSVLNESSVRIGSTLDVARTAEELAEVYTAHFADFALVDLLESALAGDETGAMPDAAPVFRRTACRSVLEGCPEVTIPVGATHGYRKDSPQGRVLTDGRGLFHAVDEAGRRWWAADSPDSVRSIDTHGIHTLLVVPLRARGITLGLAILGRHRTPEPFDDDDLLLAKELAARAAVCVDNARRYTRERDTALALQRSLLPQHAPRQAAVEVASRYRPASSRAGIGGDWFDVIPLSGARVALVVGDVVGHGVQASATMGRLRTAVRTLADVDLAPDELLTQLDDIVLRLDSERTQDAAEEPPSPGEVGATCLYAVYDPISRRCTMARAGHPVPAMVTPDGKVSFLDLPIGPPWGWAVCRSKPRSSTSPRAASSPSTLMASSTPPTATSTTDSRCSAGPSAAPAVHWRRSVTESYEVWCPTGPPTTSPSSWSVSVRSKPAGSPPGTYPRTLPPSPAPVHWPASNWPPGTCRTSASLPNSSSANSSPTPSVTADPPSNCA